ncbi:DUF6477 family protein [Paracoccus pacificus]|uniref:DUF6477 family protein n=1 Tax=Paracoccus pacificus TaxID=1463598 RepID=A0ABW4R9X5_9RHOB
MMLSNVIEFRTGRPVGQSETIRRPGALIRAARHGLELWQRGRDLRRVLRSDDLPAVGAALPRLIVDEARMDEARRDGAADYDLRRHVLLLVAILAERRDAQNATAMPPMVICPETAIRAHL